MPGRSRHSSSGRPSTTVAESGQRFTCGCRLQTSNRPLRVVIGQGLRRERRAQARSLQVVARVAGVSMGSALLRPVNVDQELAWASLRRRSEVVVPADVAWAGHGEAITGDVRAAVDPFASQPAVLPRTAPDTCQALMHGVRGPTSPASSRRPGHISVCHIDSPMNGSTMAEGSPWERLTRSISARARVRASKRNHGWS